jgi:hypothetical protein
LIHFQTGENRPFLTGRDIWDGVLLPPGLAGS